MCLLNIQKYTITCLQTKVNTFMFLIMLIVLLMMAAMLNIFFPVPGSLEGGEHLLLCGDDEQQPRGQTAVGVQL